MNEPRVLRVEYTIRDKVMGGHRIEFTDAAVRLMPGYEVAVRVPGYQAERGCYPVLIEAALDRAWLEFCNVRVNYG